MRAVKHRLILLLAIALLAFAWASPVSAATWDYVNYTEDYVDQISNLHLATPDIGTHSVFGDLQDYGANYDQMQEGNTGSAGNDVEDFVDQISDLHAPSPDVGTHSSFAEMQDKDGVFDTLTEADTGGGGFSEYRFVDTCPTLVLWTPVGSTPYLDAVDDTNKITGSGAVTWSVWIEFAATSGSGTGFTVNMSTYEKNSDADELHSWEIDWTGDSVADASGSWTPAATYAWHDAGILTGLDTQTEIDAAKIRYSKVKGAGGPGLGSIDAARLGISQAGGAVYDLDLEVGWITADYDETSGEELCIYGGTQGSEALRVDVWDGSWTNVITDLAAGWNNVSVATYLVDATFEIRFTDTSDDAVEADTWQVEGVLLHCWTDGSTNYELDLEIGWTTADNDETVERLCIYPVTGGGWPAEDIKVDVWEGSWTNVITDLIPDQWNNVSISSYLTGTAFEVRFLGGTESEDTTQDTWEIDTVLIQTWSYAYTESQYEAIGVADTDYPSLEASKTLYDSIGLADTNHLAIGWSIIQSETVGLADTIYTVFDAAMTLHESIGIADTVSTVASFAITLFGTIGIASTVMASKMIQKMLYESIGLADTIATVFAASTTLFESIGIADVISAAASCSMTLYNSIGLAYVESIVASFSLSLYESIGVAGTGALQIVVVNHLYESIGLAGIESIVVAFSSTLNESIGIASTGHLTADIVLTLAEGIGLAGTVVVAASKAKTAFESIGIADIVDATLGGGLNEKYFFESIGVAGTVATVLAASRTFYESVGIAESIANPASFAQCFFESIGIADTSWALIPAEYLVNFFESFGGINSPRVNFGAGDVPPSGGPGWPKPVPDIFPRYAGEMGVFAVIVVVICLWFIKQELFDSVAKTKKGGRIKGPTGRRGKKGR